MSALKRKSLAEDLAEDLKHKIKSGAIKVGDKIPAEPDLMNEYQVGRSTVRESIKILQHAGFINVRQGLGTVVISQTGNLALDETISASNFAEAFAVRHAIEKLIVEKATENRTDEDLIIISEYLEVRNQTAKEGKILECITADINFHTAIAMSTKNAILIELYKSLSKHIAKFFIDDYTDTSIPLRTQQLHKDLFLHIKNQDSNKALETLNTLLGTL